MTNIANNSSANASRSAERNDDFWQQALKVSDRRLNVLASNIANADTPNYKARDLDFQSALQRAMHGTTADSTSPASAAGVNQVEQTNSSVQFRIPTQAAADGNTVDMDYERNMFAQQAVRHQFMLQKVADEYKEMGNLLRNLPG